jgi:hypothetical protein
MAKQVFVLTALLVVLLAAGRAGTHADSSLDGPIIPMPLAEATGPHPDLVTKSQAPADTTTPMSSAAPAVEIVSSIAIPGTAFKVLYLFQYDSAKPGAAQTKDKPVSVIVWKALEIGSKAPVHDVRERISENSASASMIGKAIYALQSDYRLQKLALSSQEIDHVFDLLHADNGEALAADATWKGKVASLLKEVEWLDDGTHKNKNKNKQGKDKSAKDGKTTKQSKAVKPAASKSSKSTKVAASISPRASHSDKKHDKA